MTAVAADLAELGNVDAERALLGAVMFAASSGPDAAAGVLRGLEVEDFTDPRIAAAVAAARQLVEDGVAPLPALLLDRLRDQGAVRRSDSGAAAVFLAGLCSAAPNPVILPFRAALLQATARRVAVREAARLLQAAEGPGGLEVVAAAAADGWARLQAALRRCDVR
jgi:hypothetical protein